MGPLISVTDAVEVSGTRQRLWAALLAELSGAGGWWSGTNEFEAKGDPAVAGTMIGWTVRPNGPGAPGPVFRFTSTTVRAEEPGLLELDFRGLFVGRGVFRLTGDDGTSRLEFAFDVEPRGWLRALSRVVDLAAGHSTGTRRAFGELARQRDDDVVVRRAGPTAAPATWVLCGTTLAERTGHVVRTDYGDAVHVDEWATVDGRPGRGTAVLVHGWGSTARAYDRVTELLLGQGRRMVTMDLPGHGDSTLDPAGRVTLERLAVAVGQVLDRFSDGPTVLVAHSGAGLAGVMAVAGNDRLHGLVLLSTALRDAGASPPELLIQGSPLLNAALRRTAVSEALLSRTMGPTSPPPTRALTAARLRSVPPATRRAFFAASRNADVTGFGRRVTVPTVLLAGHEDMVVPATSVRTSALALARGEFRLLPGKGHALPEEAPDEVVAVVDGLLSG